MKRFGGRVLFLDRSDINTDEIIPAKYLTAVDKQGLSPHLLEDLSLEGFSREGAGFSEAGVIVTRANFGCGSSREHAVWALEVNGITAVFAESFARIFRRNMFNSGLPAVELPSAAIEEVFGLAAGGPVRCEIDMETKSAVFSSDGGTRKEVEFSLAPFDEALVMHGGWIEYADSRY